MMEHSGEQKHIFFSQQEEETKGQATKTVQESESSYKTNRCNSEPPVVWKEEDPTAPGWEAKCTGKGAPHHVEDHTEPDPLSDSVMI